MAADKYTSILAMRLQMEQRQQQQEREEALQREQMNDQMQMKSLDTMVRTGQSYFAAMKAADDRDLKLAEVKYKQDLAYEEAARKDKIARAEAAAKITAANVKMEHQTDERIATDITKEDRAKIMSERKMVITPSQERGMIKDDVKSGRQLLTDSFAGIQENLDTLQLKKGYKSLGISKTVAQDRIKEYLYMKSKVGEFKKRMADPTIRKQGVDAVRNNIEKVMQEFSTWLQSTTEGQRYQKYAKGQFWSHGEQKVKFAPTPGAGTMRSGAQGSGLGQRVVDSILGPAPGAEAPE